MIAEQIFGIFVACGFWFAASVVIEFVESKGRLIWTPRDIYDKTDFNIFGCWVLYIGLCVISPFMAIGKLVYWIFHVGRED
jgi:hypothetical protein